MNFKRCPDCGETKELNQFYHRSGKRSNEYHSYCKKCEQDRNIIWYKNHSGYRARFNHKIGFCKSMTEIDCSMYVGVHIGENKLANNILSKLYNSVEHMPINNPGFDFLCDGLKVDVKTARLSLYNNWHFSGINKITNMFLFLGLDKQLNLIKIWLIPESIINIKSGISITNSNRSLSKWKQYEISI